MQGASISKRKTSDSSYNPTFAHSLNTNKYTPDLIGYAQVRNSPEYAPPHIKESIKVFHSEILGGSHRCLQNPRQTHHAFIRPHR